MRAAFYSFKNATVNEVVELSGESFHHLSVARIKKNEKILLLNGEGEKLFGEVEYLGKKSLNIRIEKIETISQLPGISLAIATPKKDAFEDVLKMAVELGVQKIFPLISHYSQYKYTWSERVQRILESALIQSNNAYFPKIYEMESLDDFLKNHGDALAFFNSEKNENEKRKENCGTLPITALLGPEGGFSREETSKILNYKKVLEIHFKTPILRTPTAFAASIGYLLSNADKNYR